MTAMKSDAIPSPAQEWIRNHTNVPTVFPTAFLKAYREKYGLTDKGGKNVTDDENAEGCKRK